MPDTLASHSEPMISSALAPVTCNVESGGHLCPRLLSAEPTQYSVASAWRARREARAVDRHTR